MNESSTHIIPNATDARNETISGLISMPSMIFSTSDLSDLGYGKYECDEMKFGRPSIDSCNEAYGWISSSQEVLKYADRNTPGTADVPLPQRYSSSK